jgi:hypothetical protein
MQSSGSVKRIIAELCFVKMCDDSLSTTNEALLLRIANLEARLSSGEFVQPTEKKVEAPKEKAVKEEKKEEPKKEIVFADEPVVKAKQPIVNANAKSTKPLKAWSEAVQAIQSLDPSAYPILKKTRAYLGDDDKIHALYDGFGLFAIDKPIIKNTLAANLSKYLNKRYTESDIVFEQDSGKIKLEEDYTDLLDEF